MMTIELCMLGTLFIAGIFADFLASPKTLAVIRGDRAILNCSKFINTSIPLRWRKLDTGDDMTNIISSGGRLMPNFVNGSYTVDAPDNHTANLIIDPVEMSHAGRYRCSDGMKGSEDRNNSRTADLIVLAFEPECGYNVSSTTEDKTLFTMWCSVEFRGSWTPVMEWNEGTKGRINGHYVMINSSGIVTYVFTNHVNTSVSVLNDLRYSCTIKFTKLSKPLDADPANVPDFNFTHVFEITNDSSMPYYTSASVELTDMTSIFGGTGFRLFLCTLVIILIVIVAILIKYRRSKLNNESLDTGKPDVANVHRPRRVSLFRELDISSDRFEEIERISDQTVVGEFYELELQPSCSVQEPPEPYDDGTVYVEVHNSNGQKSVRRSQMPLPRPVDDGYAKIDHTKMQARQKFRIKNNSKY